MALDKYLYTPKVKVSGDFIPALLPISSIFMLEEILNTKQDVINSSNKLSADLVNDANSTNKFVSQAEKEQIATNEENISTINTTLSGYGNIVTHNTSEFASSSQGAKADTALQPNDNVSDLVNDAGYLTGITSSQVTNALGYTPYNSTNPNGYTSNTGTVTSVQVQAGTGLTSSQSTAQTGTLNTTIGVASGYKLPTTTEWRNKADTSALAGKLDASKCTYQTTAPTSAISDGGIHLVYLTSEPSTRYDGYIYFIVES